MKKNSPLVITISRQLGSGGTYIGQQLANHLNIFYADREIISQAAQKLSLLDEDLASRDEKILSFWQSLLHSLAIAPEVYTPPPIVAPSDFELFKIESEIITRIAGERSSVIIGRCGSYILREYRNHVSIFLYSDAISRKNRIQEVYGVSATIAENMIVRSDKERALYHRRVTGKEWADARDYDICLDTGKIGVEKSVEIILKYLTFL